MNINFFNYLFFLLLCISSAGITRKLPGADMESAEGCRAGHPREPRHQIQSGGAISGRGEHVLTQDVCRAV